MIRYSGYPVLYQEILFDDASALSNIVTQLQNAGWTFLRTETVADDTYSNVDGGSGYVLESRRTSQGLQCRVKIWRDDTSGYIWFRFMDTSETMYMLSPSFLVPRPSSFLRIVANPFQFFTFKYNNLEETGNVMMGGVPWLPSFLAPYTIVSASNSTGSTVDVVLSAAHPYVGELVTIDGALGATSLNHTFNASKVNSTTLRLFPCQLNGTYTANSARLAGPDRICRYIWSQATAYATSFLFHEPSITLRNMIGSTPHGVISIGDKRSNNSLIINQYNWLISNDVADASRAGAVKIFHTLPYQTRWYDGSYMAHEPWLYSGETANTNESRICAQLWDAMIAEQNFSQLDKTVQFDGFSWLVYTSMLGVSFSQFSADGALLLKVSNA